MKSLFLTAALLVSSFAVAGELDQDVANQGLTGTVVVRVDARDKSVSVMKSEQVPANKKEAQVLAVSGAFEKAPADKVRTELDNESGSSSWYWYCGYNQPYYLNWYGYNYYQTYYYSYNYYSYYYYSYYRW